MQLSNRLCVDMPSLFIALTLPRGSSAEPYKHISVPTVHKPSSLVLGIVRGSSYHHLADTNYK